MIVQTFNIFLCVYKLFVCLQTFCFNNKYKKRYQDSILKIFKLFAQIIIPILSLLVAVFSLYTKFNSDNLERIELIEQKILLIEKNEKK